MDRFVQKLTRFAKSLLNIFLFSHLPIGFKDTYGFLYIIRRLNNNKIIKNKNY